VRFWTEFRCTIHAHVVHSCPCLASPHPIQRGERICFSFSLLFHTLSSAYRATNYINRIIYNTSDNVGVKICNPLCMNEYLRFIRDYVCASPNNFHNSRFLLNKLVPCFKKNPTQLLVHMKSRFSFQF
jgi:hypothetical protein